MAVRLTIGVPCYNAEPTLAATLENLLQQSFHDFTLLVSDNASTDDSPSIIREFMTRDERVQYVRQESNIGANANYNALARMATTEYFKWHSANDLCSPNALESCIEILDGRPDVVVCYPTSYLFTDAVDEAIRYDDQVESDDPSRISRFFRVVDNLALTNVMNGVVRTRALQSTQLLGQFMFADLTLVAQLALLGKLKCAEDSSFYRRMDARSATQLKSDAQVDRHINPRWKRRPPFQTWRSIGSLLRAILSADLSMTETAQGLTGMSRRAWWRKDELWHDLTRGTRVRIPIRPSVKAGTGAPATGRSGESTASLHGSSPRSQHLPRAGPPT